MAVRGHKQLQEFEKHMTFEGMLLEGYERIKTIEEHQDKPIESTVVVIGSTGAGKSTFINGCVLRRKMETRKQDLNQVIDVEGCTPEKTVRPEIGHDVFESKTIFPEAFYRIQPDDGNVDQPPLPVRPGNVITTISTRAFSKVNTKKKVHAHKNNSTGKSSSQGLARFCDSGGLHDAGLPKFSAAIAICTQHLIRTLPIDGFVCIIAKDEITGQRGRGFKDVLTAIQRFAQVGNAQGRGKFNIKFIVSKCENSPEEVRATLEKMLVNVGNGNERLAADVKSGIELMLEKPLVTYNDPEGMLSNVTDEFLDFTGLGKQGQSVLNKALASPDAIKFLYENAPWPQILDASIKVEDASINTTKFGTCSRDLEYCIQYLLPSIAEALDLIVRDTIMGACCFGCFAGTWPFKNSYRKKLVENIRGAGLRVTRRNSRAHTASVASVAQSRPSSVSMDNVNVAVAESTAEQRWSDRFFEAFQALVTFGEFDKREFNRNLHNLKDLLFDDSIPTNEISQVIRALERKRTVLQSAGGEGIYTDFDMEHENFFGFKCSVIHMFESEIVDEIKVREGANQEECQQLVGIAKSAGGLSDRVSQEQLKINDILDNNKVEVKKNTQTFQHQKKALIAKITHLNVKVNKAFASGMCMPCSSSASKAF